MTTVTRVPGSKLLVQIGDGGSPTETFAHDCLINTSRGITFSAETQEHIMPSCDDPDEPAWKDVTKDGMSATISGAGLLHSASVESWWTWFKDDATKNVRVKINVVGSSGGGYWQGAFHLTAMEVQADGHKDTVAVNVTLVSSGALTWTDNA